MEEVQMLDGSTDGYLIGSTASKYSSIFISFQPASFRVLAHVNSC